MDVLLPVLVSTLSAVAVAVVGFQLALRQDERRWLREKRADLYIDLLSEASAETDWIERQLTEIELRHIACPNSPIDEDIARLHRVPDLRLEPRERALLGARGNAFGSLEVNRRFNLISAQFPILTRGDQAPGYKIRVRLAFVDFEDQVRHELHRAQRPVWKRFGKRKARQLIKGPAQDLIT